MNRPSTASPPVPVLISGGSGTRLWPLSRRELPKQFLPLVNPERTLFQETLERLARVSPGVRPVVICNEDHRFLAAQQAREIGLEADILLEPAARGTAAAMAAAAAFIEQTRGSRLMLVSPADQAVTRPDLFAKAAAAGIPAAMLGDLVVFGITPDRPETGFGYIQAGATDRDDAARPVRRFVEKPDLATAEDYLRQGTYLWNAGLFLFDTGAFLRELEAQSPGVVEPARESVQAAARDLDFTRLHGGSFAKARAGAVDVLLMEKTAKARVVPMPAEAGWCDVGSWDALAAIRPADADGNACFGDVVAANSQNCLLHSERGLLAAVGLQNLVVVATPDAVLVADRAQSQEVRLIIAHLQAQGRRELTEHAKVGRPWGHHEVLCEGDGFKVRRIGLAPGWRLSLQRHMQRAEHWVALRGTARMIRGRDSLELKAGTSSFIAPGEVHRLENHGTDWVEIIEIQTGAHLGDDDIERLEGAGLVG